MSLNRKDIRDRKLTLEHRHFCAIAAALRDSRPASAEQLTQWQSTVNSFIVIYKASNGRFDQERFIAACNYQEVR